MKQTLANFSSSDKMKVKEKTLVHQTSIPIDLSLPKPYNFAISQLEKDFWKRTIQLTTGKLVVTRTTQAHPLQRTLKTVIESGTRLNKWETHEVKKRIEFELGTEEKFASLKLFAKEDDIFRSAFYSIPGFRLYANSSTLEAVVNIIFSQGVNYVTFKKRISKLLSCFGKPVPWETKEYLFPRRSTLLKLEQDEWKKLGIKKSVRKIRIALENLSEIGVAIHYPDMYRGYIFMKKRGVGENITRMLLIHCARRYNLMVLDGSIRKLFTGLYGLHENTSNKQFAVWGYKKWNRNAALAAQVLITAHYSSSPRSLHKNSL